VYRRQLICQLARSDADCLFGHLGPLERASRPKANRSATFASAHWIKTKVRQLEGLALDKTFTDKASGKDVKRPQLEAMQSFVRDDDTVFCHSMDRLAHNLDDLQRILLGLTERGVHIVFVKENLTFTSEDSPMPNLLLSVMSRLRLEIAKGCHKVFDLASRRGFTGFEVALNA
jgi:Resolvase, N terminal domain